MENKSVSAMGTEAVSASVLTSDKAIKGGLLDKINALFARVPGLGWTIIIAGIAYGVLGVLLVTLGNPLNTGLCVSCFLEGTVGSLGMHGNIRMMYIRPEIIGIILGAFVMAVSTRGFIVTGGSSPVVRFVLGALMMVGSAMFMGCPIKLVYRFSAGDLTAVAGVVGLIAGVWVGISFMREGFFLGDESDVNTFNGFIVPFIGILLLVFYFLPPPFINVSGKGPGSAAAPWIYSLGFGLLFGALSQRSRFCIVGGLRNYLLARDKSLLIGVLILIGSAFLASLATGQFHFGLYDQGGTHLAHEWNFLGMFLTGFASVLLGGCPLRQLILASEGNADSGISVMGMLVGAAMVQNWGLASSTSGPTFYGKIWVLAGLIFCFLLALYERD
jgi:YedE family putative selenium metabolism protein